ncbi:hypothetical protein WKR88_15790 [Trinickia caryophylli]|uniref:Uncharacterized protein n=1 Tax=Trinickia caryophylli TaxID=28094 RepID=A0A1X7D3P7_TRICW|nr:hypothetical protein [Trinickia caryophylli]PMS12786.1 hypothetical protein C0Z17_08195 [Trinickia caryophylli]TRX15200.1 hypothetical protein FNF07_28865 [Trinickia caryophylli]WQE15070.1 hypothetical protein U0034_21185 [Trinickia caryophylli]SMF07746.1 hypothetical protein SAMN06295900_102323 [Trinickia caryophylli]GLU31197.1 hypothetical protein Busp01_10390 [Trinickia caryophylli]
MSSPNEEPNAALSKTSLPSPVGQLGKSPVHLLAAIVTVAMDKLWDMLLLDMGKALPPYEKARFYLGAGMVLLIATTISTALTQHCIEKDPLGMALAKGVAMGILAGLPYSFSTTEMGLVFIGWSGINELQKVKK